MTKERSKKLKKRIALLIIVAVLLVLVYPMFYAEMLKAAIVDSNVNRVRVLLALPGNVDYRFSAPLFEINTKTPLDIDCMNDNYEMMELLLQNGANPSADPGSGQPLSFVLSGKYQGLLERTKLLAENGAMINIGDGRERQPIQSLFGRSDYRDRATLAEANAEVLKTLKYLVEHGADIESYYKAGTFQRLLYTIIIVENYMNSFVYTSIDKIDPKEVVFNGQWAKPVFIPSNDNDLYFRVIHDLDKTGEWINTRSEFYVIRQGEIEPVYLKEFECYYSACFIDGYLYYYEYEDAIKLRREGFSH